MNFIHRIAAEMKFKIRILETLQNIFKNLNFYGIVYFHVTEDSVEALGSSTWR